MKMEKTDCKGKSQAYQVVDATEEVYARIECIDEEGLPPVFYDMNLCMEMSDILFENYLDGKGFEDIQDFFLYENRIHKLAKKPGRNSIMLYSEELYRCDEFVDRLSKLLGIDFVLKRSFKELETHKYNDKINMIYITDCPEKPIVDYEAGTGEEEEEQKKRLREFLKKWDKIKKLMDDSPNVIFIISTRDYIYRDYYSDEPVLNSVYFKKKLKINKISPKELADKVVLKLMKYGLKVKNEAYHALKEYIDNDYGNGAIMGKDYVNYLTKEIFASISMSADFADMEFVDVCHIPKLRKPTLEEIFEEFDRTVYGQEKVREQLVKICNQSLFKQGITDETSPDCNHMLFIGGPGTGKTKIARLTAKILHAAGVIKKKNPVEISGNDLESKWGNGHNVYIRNKIREAYGGVLFIDEAYAIAELPDYGHGGNKAKEIINILIKEMWDNRDKLVVIFAGYEDKMDELFSVNQGLKNRIAHIIRFDNYTLDNLMELLSMELKKRKLVVQDDGTMEDMKRLVRASMYEDSFGSVRGIKRLVQDIVSEYYKSVQTMDNYRSIEIHYINSNHIRALMPEEVDTCISSLVGITAVKQRIEEFKQRAVYEKMARESGINVPKSSRHMLFSGNPGTGKTTVARCLAQELYNCDVLLTNKVVVINPGDLVSTGDRNYKELLREKLTKAKGGVLFVDEAYSLANKGSYYGQEVIEELLIAMEERKEDTIFVFAGYTEEMQEFMDSNPGIKSRIGREICFQDYSVDELVEIFHSSITRNGYKCTEDTLSRVKDIIQHFHGSENLGNGRFIENLISSIIDKKAVNMAKLEEILADDIMCIYAMDVPTVEEMTDIVPQSYMISRPIGFI